MAKELTQIKVGENNAPKTPEELEALLGAYELQNPAKFAIKKARGEFDKLSEKLGKKK